LSEISCGDKHFVYFVKLTLLIQYTQYSRLFIGGVSAVRPYHHVCAVQQWRHHLTACVKASDEHLEHSQ